mmetsp:Transcript_19692/g.40351  ORF Transcript_19692/g.40351 Transcript_19692/m.40351 type:complete len:214 (+) Transcript_19692:150-791(+)
MDVWRGTSARDRQNSAASTLLRICTTQWRSVPARACAYTHHQGRQRPSRDPERTTLGVGVLGDSATENQAEDGCELHHDVQCRARGVLEWVSHRVASHGILVRLRALPELRPQAAGRDVLLGVVPSSAGVAHGNGKLHTGDKSTGEEASAGVLPEAETGDEGAEDDEGARGQHLPKGGISGDADAPVVVWGHLLRPHDLRELLKALLHHVIGG